MDHICALPDNGLKANLAREIFRHLEIPHVMPWRNMSKFWRAECAQHVKDVCSIVIKNDGNNYMLKQIPTTEVDLSNFFFVCLNISEKARSTLKIEVYDAHFYKDISHYYKKVLTGQFDGGKMRIADLFLRKGLQFYFLLDWFEPEFLILEFAGKERNADWTKMKSVITLHIYECAEKLIDTTFYQTVPVENISCFFTTTEKFSYEEITTMIKDWQADRREISQICFNCDKDRQGNAADFNVLAGIQRLLGLLGGNIQITEEETPTRVEASINIQDNDGSAWLRIGLKKENNTNISFYLEAEIE